MAMPSIIKKWDLQLIHMDLFGPIRTISLGGKPYAFVLVDDFSRYTWVLFLSTKDKALEKFITFSEIAQNDVGQNISHIRSDHATEFQNLGFEDFCNENGISHNYSAPRTPQQNANGGEESSKVDEMPTKEETQDPPLEALKNISLDEREVSYPRELNYVKGCEILGDPSKGVTTRYSLRNTCNFVAFISCIEPKNINEALNDDYWILAMQDELNKFERSNHRVLKMGNHRALYGLKQAPRAWYERLSTFLVEKGFSKGKVDTTLFIKNVGKDILVVQIYVDDIIFGSTNELLCQDFAKLMQGEKDDIKEKLKKFGLENVKPQATPMSSSIKLDKDEEGKCVDSKLYRSMIGSLLYLTASRPDIIFSVCLCARFQANPKESHLKAIKRIFRYLQDTPSLGLWYPRDSNFDLHAYSDADYGGCKIDRKSTSGSCQFLGNMLISWFTKKQNSVHYQPPRQNIFRSVVVVHKFYG
ncbi:hypothetical protein GQ457_11G024920 [Hibiscus cannabinus]